MDIIILAFNLLNTIMHYAWIQEFSYLLTSSSTDITDHKCGGISDLNLLALETIF